jgi:hypothetical protein
VRFMSGIQIAEEERCVFGHDDDPALCRAV